MKGSRQTLRRRGATTIFLVVSLAVLGVVCAATFQAIALRQRLARHEQYRDQAWWLAEAGLERALARLQVEPSYTSETWHISATELGGASDALVTVQVHAVGEESGRREVVAVADYPVGAGAVRQTRRLSLKQQPEGNHP
ncbi:MAG: hypothetical protein AB7U73_10800 [Pirellulales bacterium]